jgi:hypothetical protein
MWLVCLMVSREERRRLETAARVLYAASYRRVDGLEYLQAIRE